MKHAYKLVVCLNIIHYNQTMKIGVIGLGYVGVVTAVGLAAIGHEVWGIDIDDKKIKLLKEGKSPIYEPGLDELILKHRSKLHFSSSLKEIVNIVDVIYIAVGTPSNPDGSADLSYVFSVAKEIGENVNKSLIIVNKSTVPVGTAEKVKNIIINELARRQKERLAAQIDVVSNPEFLREGNAIYDFFNPDRIVIGAFSSKTAKVMLKVYKYFKKQEVPILIMDPYSAELTKYAANSLLATKISFINEISKIAEGVGANIEHIKIGIGTDKRIGMQFLNAGIGFGGSCFPKDVKAIIDFAEKSGVSPILLKSTLLVNSQQKLNFAYKIIKYFKYPKEHTLGVWGITFKPNTDDVRESPALEIVKYLALVGFNLKVHDPQGVNNAKKILKFPNVKFVKDKYEAVVNASALVLLTEWQEYQKADLGKVASLLKKRNLFDGRNIFIERAKELLIQKFAYYPVGYIPIVENKFNIEIKPKGFSDDILDELTVLVPAYNEESRVGKAILPFLRAGIKVIVVDDGSKDKTYKELKKLRKSYAHLEILKHSKNKGKLAAVLTGVEKIKTKYVLLTDADLKFESIKPIIKSYFYAYYRLDRFMINFENRKNLLDFITTRAISGTRLMPTQQLKQALKELTKTTSGIRGYLLESFLNYWHYKNKIHIFYSTVVFDHAMKYKKYGIKGWLQDAKMALTLITSKYMPYNVYTRFAINRIPIED